MVKGLWDILGTTYWTRIWIVQEILHARSIVLMRGTATCIFPSETLLSLQMFHQLYWYLESRTSVLDYPDIDPKYDMLERGRLATTLLSHRGVITYEGLYYKLRTALTLCFDRKCSDWRGRVFGLQAIVTPEQRIGIDYGLSAEEVFEKVHLAIGDVDGSGNSTEKFLNDLREGMEDVHE